MVTGQDYQCSLQTQQGVGECGNDGSDGHALFVNHIASKQTLVSSGVSVKFNVRGPCWPGKQGRGGYGGTRLVGAQTLTYCPPIGTARF